MKKILQALVVIVVAAASAVAGEFEIGTLGATMILDESWERISLNPDLGRDQFVSDKGLYCVITESKAMIEGRPGLERMVDNVISAIGASFEIIDEDSRVLYEDRDGLGRVTRRLSVNVNGIRIAYQIDAVGRDGLGYLLMTWAPLTKTTDLYDWASRAARSITMPPPDSEWGRHAVPTTHSMRFGTQVLEIDFRESVFIDAGRDDADSMWSLNTFEDEVAVHSIILESDGDLESYLDGIVEMLDSDSDTAEESDRRDIQIPLGVGREIRIAVSEGGIASYVVVVAVVPIENDRLLDFRMVSMASGWTVEREASWQRLLATIRVLEDPAVDAFPTSRTGATEMATLNVAAKALVDASQVLGSSDRWGSVFLSTSDGALLVHEGNRIVAMAAGDAEDEVLFQARERYSPRVLAMWGGELLILDNDHRVVRITDHRAEPLGFSASRISVIDADRLLLVRDREPPHVLGFEYLPQSRPVELLVRDRAGRESSITSLSEQSVVDLAVAPDGETVFLAAIPRDLLGPRVDPVVEVRRIDLSTGENELVSTWRAVSSLSACDAGWLVAGTPSDGPRGLYLVNRSGAVELLISGEIQGIALTPSGLRYATNFHLYNDDESAPVVSVYDTPLMAVRAHGPSCRPLTVETLNLIASNAEAISKSDLSTVAGIRSYLEAANTSSQRLVGLPFPADAAAVDQLLADVAYDESLTESSIALLASMVADTLLRSGAEWVPGAVVDSTSQSWNTGWIGENLFAVALQPIQIVTSTLFSDESWWHPLDTIEDLAGGRSLLVGTDSKTLATALSTRATPASAAIVESADPQKLQRLFEAQPANTHLRERVYLRLASLERFEALESLSGSMVLNERPQLCDRRAWAAAMLRLGLDGLRAEGVIEELRQAILMDPDEASLYLLLGAAYEQCERPDRADYARACYLRTIELQGWGQLNDDAQLALDALDSRN